MAFLGTNVANIKPASTPVENLPSARKWSDKQEAVFDFARNGVGNAIVEAVAGSGKSTTIVEALARLPEDMVTVFLAFNKAIADELKARGVNARTFHSLTYSAVTRSRGVRNIDADKMRTLARRNLNGDDSMKYATFITKLASMGKQVGIGCLVPDIPEVWLDIVQWHDLELEDTEADLGRAISLASDLLQWSNESDMVDFDDLLYLAVKDGLSLPKFDFIFVDEAQDTNAIQRAILRKIMKPNSRMIAVGDPAQAIYGFRGSDSNSLRIIQEEFRCASLPLTVSYRCPTNVVNYARQWVDHIEAAPGAPEGVVTNKGIEWKLTEFESDDLVVCRTTKPLIQLAYRFMKAKIPAFVMGREIGAGMKSLVNKMKASNIDEFLASLEIWEERETQKAIAKGDDVKVEALRDKADALRCIVDGLAETDRSVSSLLNTIDQLFAEGVDKITLATIHKSKGLESRRVWWLNRAQCPAKWSRQPWQQVQETNLCYVATTRAKTTLLMIDEPK